MFPLLTYGVVVWVNTYNSLLKPLITSQKKAVRIMTYSNFREHSSPLFKRLNILKFPDLLLYRIALFRYDYCTNRLPRAFSNFFEKVNNRHNYNTKLAARESYSLPLVTIVEQTMVNLVFVSLELKFGIH